ncbi:MAG: cell division protein FtsQ/DivIB [Akkermansiaceae bacterium]
MPKYQSRTSRKRTSRAPRTVRKGGDLQKLHLNVSSPRIVMFQFLKGLTQFTKLAVVLSLIGFICYGGYRGVQHLFLGNEKYILQEIELNTNGKLSHARVVDIADIDLGASIFALDIEKLQANIQTLPEVISCDVERRLPGKLRITLVERSPVAWVQSTQLGYPGRMNGGILIDAEGITFPCEGLLWDTAQDLPVIVIGDAIAENFQHGSQIKHLDTQRALHLIKQFETQDVRSEWLPERVILVNSYSMQAACNDGSRATFGMYNHERQLADFVTIREHSLKTGREVENINLIPKINIPVTFADNSNSYSEPTHTPDSQRHFNNQDQHEIQSILGRN